MSGYQNKRLSEMDCERLATASDIMHNAVCDSRSERDKERFARARDMVNDVLTDAEDRQLVELVKAVLDGDEAQVSAWKRLKGRARELGMSENALYSRVEKERNRRRGAGRDFVI